MAQQPKATHWRSVHKRKNADLLYAEDIGPPGTTVDVEIVESGIVTVPGVKGLYEDATLPWIAFDGKRKRLGLNRTNCKTMVSLTGTPVVEQWRGWVTLIVVVTDYNDRQTGRREKTDAIRVAPERPRGKKASASHQSTQTSGSGATIDPAGAQLTAPTPTDDELEEIARRDREEASRG